MLFVCSFVCLFVLVNACFYFLVQVGSVKRPSEDSATPETKRTRSMSQVRPFSHCTYVSFDYFKFNFGFFPAFFKNE